MDSYYTEEHIYKAVNANIYQSLLVNLSDTYVLNDIQWFPSEFS